MPALDGRFFTPEDKDLDFESDMGEKSGAGFEKECIPLRYEGSDMG